MKELIKELNSFANPDKIATYKNFHKTDSDGYASGESFLGITVPNLRKIAKNHLNLSYKEILILLSSKVHEEKYVAALILVEKYKKENKKEAFDFYIRNTSKITGWDLVDTTAPEISGPFLYDMSKKDAEYSNLLVNLAKSKNFWERRISIISTYYYIKQGEFAETIKIAEILLNDSHDLIQKAVGWMLREVGNRDVKVLELFLKKHYKKMPRTMLRYSIEKFPEKQRQKYLKGEIK